MTDLRELFINQVSNSDLLLVSCGNCKWRITLKPTAFITRDHEAEQVFDRHLCEEYPEN